MIIITWSCDSLKEIGPDLVIHIEKDSLETPSNIHNMGIIKDVELISLSKGNVAIGPINNIIVNDTLIYLLDNARNHCVYIFALSGQYLRTVSRRGKGHSEYIELSDIFVDKHNKTLNLLSRTDKKMLVFDAVGKKFLKTISLPKRFTSISPLNDGGYIGYMGNYSEGLKESDNFWIMDSNFKILEHFGKIKPERESRLNADTHVFSSYHSEANIISEMDYNVFKIDSTSKIGRVQYQYDFGKYNLPINITKKMLDNPEESFKIQNNYVHNIVRFQQKENYCLAVIMFQGQYRIIVWQKETSTSKVASLDTYKAKYLCGFGEIKGLDENYIISMEDARTMYDIWTGHDEYNDFEKEYPKQVNNLRKKFPVVSPNDNPYLILYKLN